MILISTYDLCLIGVDQLVNLLPQIVNIVVQLAVVVLDLGEVALVLLLQLMTLLGLLEDLCVQVALSEETLPQSRSRVLG
jgi:hypothetical protein